MIEVWHSIVPAISKEHDTNTFILLSFNLKKPAGLTGNRTAPACNTINYMWINEGEIQLPARRPRPTNSSACLTY